jgi:hypothetical protein
VRSKTHLPAAEVHSVGDSSSQLHRVRATFNICKVRNRMFFRQEVAFERFQPRSKIHKKIKNACERVRVFLVLRQTPRAQEEADKSESPEERRL